MTLDELKSIATSGEMGEILSNLAPEILALVEAANFDLEGHCDCPICIAVRAFNAKLEGL